MNRSNVERAFKEAKTAFDIGQFLIATDSRCRGQIRSMGEQNELAVEGQVALESGDIPPPDKEGIVWVDLQPPRGAGVLDGVRERELGTGVGQASAAQGLSAVLGRQAPGLAATHGVMSHDQTTSRLQGQRFDDLLAVGAAGGNEVGMTVQDRFTPLIIAPRGHRNHLLHRPAIGQCQVLQGLAVIQRQPPPVGHDDQAADRKSRQQVGDDTPHRGGFTDIAFKDFMSQRKPIGRLHPPHGVLPVGAMNVLGESVLTPVLIEDFIAVEAHRSDVVKDPFDAVGAR
jgi:hypothetical protein